MEVCKDRIRAVIKHPEVQARGFMLGVDRLFNIEYTGTEYINLIRDHVSRKGSALLTTNHESHVDSAVLIRLRDRHMASVTDRFTMVASTKLFPEFYDCLSPEQQRVFAGEIYEHKQSVLSEEAFVMRQIASWKKCDLIPLVQSDRVGNHAFARLNVQLNASALQRFGDALRTTGGLGVYYLEGTRSQTGVIGPALAGVNRFYRDEQLRKSMLVVPIGIEGTRDVYDRDGLHDIRAPIHATIGKPYTLDELDDDSRTYGISRHDLMMVRVAELLPNWKRGVYNGAKYQQYMDRVPRFIEDEE